MLKFHPKSKAIAKELSKGGIVQLSKSISNVPEKDKIEKTIIFSVTTTFPPSVLM